MRPGMGNAEYECTLCGVEKEERLMASGNPEERTGICDSCNNLKEPNAFKTVSYREKETDDWKQGILLDDGDGHILDMEGNPIKECWDYHESSMFGKISIEKEADELVIRIKPKLSTIYPKGWDVIDSSVEDVAK